jgi:hypothetical protein
VEAASITLSDKETGGPGIGCELRNDWAARRDSFCSYPARLVDVNRVWRSQHESCVYRLVDGGIWSHEWHFSIRRLPSNRPALRSPARLYHQHPMLFPCLHLVPLPELRITSFQWGHEPDSRTAHYTAAHDNSFLYNGIW